MRLILAAAIGAAMLPTGAQAAERNYSLTSFSKLVVTGAYQVTVTTGQGASAHAEGSAASLDALSIDQTGESVTIRGNGTSDSGDARGPVVITVTTPALEKINVAGSGTVQLDHLAGDRPSVTLVGTGTLQIAHAEGDHLGVMMAGTGSLSIAGKAAIVGMLVQGTGSLDAGGLAAEDLTVMASGSGAIKAAASRTAEINATGSVVVTVAGKPACHTKAVGSSSVTCGTQGS